MITIQASKHPLHDDWITAEVAPGQTIREICGDVPIHAWINGREVSATFIEKARLKDGVQVTIRPTPQNGRILASVLLIGVAIAATVVSGGALGPEGLGLVASSSTFAGGAGAVAVGAGIAIAGPIQLKVNP